jgi:hypothetical protein
MLRTAFLTAAGVVLSLAIMAYVLWLGVGFRRPADMRKAEPEKPLKLKWKWRAAEAAQGERESGDYGAIEETTHEPRR